MHTYTGFLVSLTKYGDQDAILHLVTNEAGFQSFYVKNIYAKKNKKKPYLSLLNELQIVTSKGFSKGNLKTASKLDLVSELQVATDFKAQSIVFFISEVFNSIFRNEENSNWFYKNIIELRHQLENGHYHCHLILLVVMLRNLGASPLLSEHTFLDPEEGAFINQMYNRYFSEEISTIWKNILQSQEPFKIEIKNQNRKMMMDSLLIYYQLHIPGFKTPESLEVLQQIFEG